MGTPAFKLFFVSRRRKIDSFPPLVAIAIAGATDFLFLAIISSAGAAVALARRLFPGGSFFALTFAKLVAVYAAILAFFEEASIV